MDVKVLTGMEYDIDFIVKLQINIFYTVWSYSDEFMASKCSVVYVKACICVCLSLRCGLYRRRQNALKVDELWVDTWMIIGIIIKQT